MKNFTKPRLCIAVLLAISCNGIAEKTVDTGNGQIPQMQVDSLLLNISFLPECHLPHPDSTGLINGLDIFIYRTEGTRELEYHEHFDGFPDSLEIKVSEGGKIVAAICNFPYTFNLEALRKFDSMSLLSLGPDDENKNSPMLSGNIEIPSTGNGIIPVSLHLTPLLCCVRITAVSNALDGYELLENPRVRLSGRNPEAEIMRADGFRPKEAMSDSEPVPLPYDIGFYTQEPGIDLFCYPNDTPEDVLGTSRTGIDFECEIEGRTCIFTERLPPFGRGSFLQAELTVLSPDEAIWKVEILQE